MVRPQRPDDLIYRLAPVLLAFAAFAVFVLLISLIDARRVVPLPSGSSGTIYYEERRGFRIIPLSDLDARRMRDLDGGRVRVEEDRRR